MSQRLVKTTDIGGNDYEVVVLIDPATGLPATTPSSAPVVLLAAASATGSWVSWPGGRATWTVTGTWGGTSAQLQISDDGGTTAIDVDGAVLTANGGFTDIPLPAYKVRVKLTGGSGISLSSKLSRSS